MAVKALLEVVESGSKNVEVVVLKFKQPMRVLDDKEVEQVVQEIEKEKKEGLNFLITLTHTMLQKKKRKRRRKVWIRVNNTFIVQLFSRNHLSIVALSNQIYSYYLVFLHIFY